MSAPTATAPTGRRREGRVRKPLLYVIASLGLLVMAAPLLWMVLSGIAPGRTVAGPLISVSDGTSRAR